VNIYLALPNYDRMMRHELHGVVSALQRTGMISCLRIHCTSLLAWTFNTRDRRRGDAAASHTS